ncbi:MAG: energy transducer TonB [Myxococcales bacterium FL481]|nr:MAG: energy transducer TonB [Myxococcales bacterium FL481]
MAKPSRGRGVTQQLSARPVLLTDMDRTLRRHYPNEARAQQIEGHARLQLVVSRRGRPSQLRVIESVGHPAFGEACRRAVARSRWRPARDRSGDRVATRILYRCKFEVDS